MKYFFLILGLFLTPFLVLAETRQQFQFDFSSTSFLYDRSQNTINESTTIDTHYLLHFNNQKNFVFHLDPRIRYDFNDSSRNRYQPHEAYLGFYKEHLDFRFGLQKIIWGNGSLFNPIDVVNRTDLGGNYILREKLSDPIVSLLINRENPTSHSRFFLEFHALPYFIKTPLPSHESRFALDGEQNSIPYSLADEQDTPANKDAFGLATSMGWDGGHFSTAFFYYRGPEHVPGYALRINNDGALTLRPFYYNIDMFGGQYTLYLKNFDLKFSGGYKSTDRNTNHPHDIQPVDDDAIPANSFEYLLGIDYHMPLTSDQHSLDLSLEYLATLQDSSAFANPVFFDRDILVAAKYLSQGNRAARLIIGLVKNVENREWVAIMDSSTLVLSRLRVGTQFFYADPVNNSALSLFDNPSFLKGYLSYSWGK